MDVKVWLLVRSRRCQLRVQARLTPVPPAQLHAQCPRYDLRAKPLVQIRAAITLAASEMRVEFRMPTNVQ